MAGRALALRARAAGGGGEAAPDDCHGAVADRAAGGLGRRRPGPHPARGDGEEGGVAGAGEGREVAARVRAALGALRVAGEARWISTWW